MLASIEVAGRPEDIPLSSGRAGSREQMTQIRTRVSPSIADFDSDERQLRAAVDDLRSRQLWAMCGRPSRALSGWGQCDAAPSSGLIPWYRLVPGVPYLFIANDATVRGGSCLPVSIKKHV